MTKSGLKIFEKLLAAQITIYLKLNNILFTGQHGFRNGHSCETALHELISDLNLNRDKRLISLLLFIDFRKAFDLVDSRKLLRKLFHYGFDNSALNLIANYFTDRFQGVKFNRKLSSLMLPSQWVNAMLASHLHRENTINTAAFTSFSSVSLLLF